MAAMMAATFSQAQGVWSGEVTANAWTYGFSSATDGTFNSSSAGLVESISPPPVTDPVTIPFLPVPPSGTTRVMITQNASASSFVLQKATNTLTINSKGTGAIKFSGYNIANASEIASMSFTTTFGRTGTTVPANNVAFLWSMGFKDENGNLYNNSNAVNYSGASNKNLFNALRFLYNSTNQNYAVGYRAAGATAGSTYTTLNGGSLSEDITYKIEVYSNNSAVLKSYVRSGTTYDVASESFHLWITNTTASPNTSVRYGIKPGTVVLYDIPKSVETSSTTGDLNIPVNTALNSFLFQATANTDGYAKMTLTGDLKVAFNATTLPVSLTSFTGEKANNGIRLNWKTASELNNDHFDILRSTNGQTFSTLTSVAGKGTSNQVNTSSYLDNAPESGTNYYKLKQVDKDGTATVSDMVVAVDGGLSATNAFSANLSNNTLNASFDAVATGTASLSLTDLSGRKVFSKSFAATKGSNNISLATPSLNAGIYVVTLFQNGSSKSIKIVK